MESNGGGRGGLRSNWIPGKEGYYRWWLDLVGERRWARSTWAQARLPCRGNLWRGGDQHPDDRRSLDEEYQRLHRAAGNLHPRGKNGRCVQPSNDILRKLRVFSLFLSLGKESKCAAWLWLNVPSERESTGIFPFYSPLTNLSCLIQKISPPLWAPLYVTQLCL